MDPLRNSSNRMSVQAINPAREEPWNPQCWSCGDYGHVIKACPAKPPGPKDQMAPGAASKVGDRPLPRDKGEPEKRTGRDKYNK